MLTFTKLLKMIILLIFTFFLLIINLSLISAKNLSLKSKDLKKCKNYNFTNIDFKIDSLQGAWYPLIGSESIGLFL
jgi:hypothetical protein